MPNWCSNDLRINGPLAEVNKVIEVLKGENGAVDFNKVIPYPEEFKKQDVAREEFVKNNGGSWKDAPKDGYNNGGYEWCRDTWGTKWNACLEDGVEWHLDSDDEECASAAITFDTAWSPPEPIIKKLIEDYPECTFELHYYEQGAGYQGCVNNESHMHGTYHGNRGG